ncbi:MAG: hypothetical protein FWB98_07215 [Defluviitaleaceae bacterium]|nr:hypothetical protein [Defluviitaleaceae bacterium]
MGTKNKINRLVAVIIGFGFISFAGWFVLQWVFAPPTFMGSRWEVVDSINPDFVVGDVWHFRRNGQVVVNGQPVGAYSILVNNWDWFDGVFDVQLTLIREDFLPTYPFFGYRPGGYAGLSDTSFRFRRDVSEWAEVLFRRVRGF